MTRNFLIDSGEEDTEQPHTPAAAKAAMGQNHLALRSNLKVLFGVDAVSGIASVRARPLVTLLGNLSQDSVKGCVSVQDVGEVLSIPFPQAGHALLLSLLQCEGAK